ncbi:MAG: hypothetical protein C4300_00080 [Thermus sp.]
MTRPLYTISEVEALTGLSAEGRLCGRALPLYIVLRLRLSVHRCCRHSRHLSQARWEPHHLSQARWEPHHPSDQVLYG